MATPAPIEVPMARRFAKARAPEPPTRGAPVATALLLGIVVGVVGTLGVQRALGPGPGPAGEGTPATAGAGAEPEVRTLPAFEFYDLLPRDRVVVPDPGERPAPGATAPLPGDGPPWLLQAGSFREADDADRRRAEILLLGLTAFTRRVRVDDGSVWHRVLVGPFEDPAALRDAKTRLGGARIDTLVLRPAA
jgi:hypothetical protein